MKCPSKRSICTGLVIFFVGGMSYGGLNAFFDYTNRTEFCVSCHSMQKNYSEYKQTQHFKNPSGVQTTCADCHVPKAFFSVLYSKLAAAKDVYHEIAGTVDTQEKFEARRWILANLVWARMRESDSRECRGCHDYDSMDLAKQDRRANKKHSNAPHQEKTCIDCHSGIAHEEPLEPIDEAAMENSEAARGG